MPPATRNPPGFEDEKWEKTCHFFTSLQRLKIWNLNTGQRCTKQNKQKWIEMVHLWNRLWWMLTFSAWGSGSKKIGVPNRSSALNRTRGTFGLTNVHHGITEKWEHNRTNHKSTKLAGRKVVFETCSLRLWQNLHAGWSCRFTRWYKWRIHECETGCAPCGIHCLGSRTGDHARLKLDVKILILQRVWLVSKFDNCI